MNTEKARAENNSRHESPEDSIPSILSFTGILSHPAKSWAGVENVNAALWNVRSHFRDLQFEILPVPRYIERYQSTEKN